MKRPHRLALPFLAALCSSCTPHEVELTIDTTPAGFVAKLSQPWRYGLGKGPPCISDVELISSKGTIWEIRSAKGNCASLPLLVFGQTPRGFTEVHRAELPGRGKPVQLWAAYGPLECRQFTFGGPASPCPTIEGRIQRPQ